MAEYIRSIKVVVEIDTNKETRVYKDEVESLEELYQFVDEISETF